MNLRCLLGSLGQQHRTLKNSSKNIILETLKNNKIIAFFVVIISRHFVYFSGSQQDFLKAVKGVGNIFRFLGIIQPKMKRFFYTKTMSGRMRNLTV